MGDMNTKNNENSIKMYPKTPELIGFYPLPVKRMGDKDLHRTIVYNKMGDQCFQPMSAKQSFEGYAMEIACEAGIDDPKGKWTKSRYGIQLANGEVFIKVVLQTEKPTEGFLNLFAIRSLCDNPSMGIFICMKNGVSIPCVSSVACVYEKIHNAQNYYDPDFIKHPKEGIPYMPRDTAMLPEDIVVGNQNESPLTLHTEKDVRLIYDLCDHILAMSPDKMLTGVKGLRQRLAPMIDKIDNDQKIRAQGLAAGNGKPMAMDPKSTVHEEMVPRALFEAVRAENERHKKQNQHLIAIINEQYI